MQIGEFKAQFDQRLLQYLDAKLATHQALFGNERVRMAIQQAVTIAGSGGKRLRPYVAYLTYCSAGGNSRRILWEKLVGIELLHLFALTHDDIIDNAPERHDVSTVHYHLLPELLRSDSRDPRHESEAQAMLVGDILLNWACQCMYGGALVPGLEDIFSNQLVEMVVGEMVDVDLLSHSSVQFDDILEKHRYKTARYTFVRPMLTGALLATSKPEWNTFAWEFGEPIGLAYQIQDDLLDIKSVDSGKPSLLDLKARQHTYISQYVMEHADEVSRAVLLGYYEGIVSDEDVLDMLHSCGAVGFAESMVKEYIERGMQVLAGQEMESEWKAVWEGLLVKLVHRSA